MPRPTEGRIHIPLTDPKKAVAAIPMIEGLCQELRGVFELGIPPDYQLSIAWERVTSVENRIRDLTKSKKKCDTKSGAS